MNGDRLSGLKAPGDEAGVDQGEHGFARLHGSATGGVGVGHGDRVDHRLHFGPGPEAALTAQALEGDLPSFGEAAGGPTGLFDRLELRAVAGESQAPDDSAWGLLGRLFCGGRGLEGAIEPEEVLLPGVGGARGCSGREEPALLEFALDGVAEEIEGGADVFAD